MPDILPVDAPASVAFLEHYPETGEGAHRLLLDHFPFCIGRNASAHYCINSRHVSKEHAQLVRNGGIILIRDLGSTNGTFVNGQRVQEAVLNHGDIVHVAHKEFRFGRDDAFVTDGDIVNTDRASSSRPVSAIQNAEHLKELLRREGARTLFQPIVELHTTEAIGHEALGRGTHDKLSASPAYLFSVAAQCNLAPELSRLFRRVAVREAAGLPTDSRVFLNLHPTELRDATFLKSLEGVPAALGGRQVVLEFHEEAVTDRAAMRRLRDQLTTLGIGLAYDDFGAGQSRLSELAEVPPDFVKLDKSLIHDLHESAGRQDLVRALARLAGDLGIRIIAEGVEIEEEAAACLDLGCHFGQGYFFGRPQPIAPSAQVEIKGGSTRLMPTLR